MSIRYGGPEFFGQASTPPPSGVARVAASTKRALRSGSSHLGSFTKNIFSCIIMPSRRAPVATADSQPNNELCDQLNDVLDPRSAIANAENVHRAVANPYYWSLLSDADRTAILNLWPDQKAVIYAGTPKAVLDFDSIKVNRDLRVNCRQYSEDHQAGRHEPEWLASAERAHVNRAEGLYDKMRADHIEQQFGVPMPGQAKPSEGQNGGETSAAAAAGSQQKSPATNIVVSPPASQENQNVAEDPSVPNQQEEIIVQTQAAEPEATNQQGPTAEQDLTIQQKAAGQEGVAAEKATVESEQTAGTIQVANAESDKGKKADDVATEASNPTTRSGPLRRSKRQSSRSNPISRAPSS